MKAPPEKWGRIKDEIKPLVTTTKVAVQTTALNQEKKQ